MTARQRSGAIVRVHRGVYRLRGVAETFESRVWAAYLACDPGEGTDDDTMVCGLTAARVWKMVEGDSQFGERIEMAVGPSRRLHVAGIDAKRTLIVKADRYRWEGVSVTSPLRTLFDLAAKLPKIELENALDTALRNRLTAVPSLQKRLLHMDRRGVAGIENLAQLLRARSDGRHRSKSVLERKALNVLRAAGLAIPESQWRVEMAKGGPRFLDLAYPAHRVAIELDSWQWHAQRSDWSADHTRNSTLTAMGWRILHITWDDLVYRPEYVVKLVSQALGLAA